MPRCSRLARRQSFFMRQVVALLEDSISTPASDWLILTSSRLAWVERVKVDLRRTILFNRYIYPVDRFFIFHSLRVQELVFVVGVYINLASEAENVGESRVREASLYEGDSGS